MSDDDLFYETTDVSSLQSENVESCGSRSKHVVTFGAVLFRVGVRMDGPALDTYMLLREQSIVSLPSKGEVTNNIPMQDDTRA